MSSEKDNAFIELFKQYERIIGVLVAFIGLTLNILSFSQALKTSPTTLTWILVSIGSFILLSSLAWISFSWRTVKATVVLENNNQFTYKENRFTKKWRLFAMVSLVVLLFATLLVGYKTYQHRQALGEKFVVLITQLHELNDKSYGLTEQLIVQLNESVKEYDDVAIITIDKKVREQQGTEYARDLGEKYQADLILWGWYSVTDTDTLLTLHIENLDTHTKSLPLEKSGTHSIQVSIAELNSFSIQHKVGQDFSDLISFIQGFVHYEAERYEQSIKYFENLAKENAFIEADIVLFYRGTNYSRLNKYEKAIDDLTQSLEINPEFSKAYNNRGVTYINLGEPEKAIEDYNQALQISPEFKEAYSNRGISYSKLGEYKKAIEDYDQALQIDPKYADAYNNRGISYNDLGEYEKAIENYNQAIQIASKFSNAYNNRGNTYRNLGEYEIALENLNQALEIDPEYAAAYYNRGKTYYDLGEYEKAIEDYIQAILYNPEDALAYNNRGIIYADLGEYERAIEDYNQALEINSELSIAYYNRGNTHRELGKNEKAIEDYSQAIRLNSNFSCAYKKRGIVYGILGKYERAVKDFDQAIDINPQDAIAYFNRGFTYYLQKEYEKAIEDCEQSLLINVEDAKAYAIRGASYFSLGEYEKAIEDLSQAVLIDTEYVEGYFNRGFMYRKQGEYEKMIADFRQAAELAPNQAIHWNRLCWYGSLTGYAEESLYACENAVDLKPDSGAFYDSRGVARAITGDYAGAIEDFRFYVEWKKEKDEYDASAKEREEWIIMLEKGENPFNESTLQKLLEE